MYSREELKILRADFWNTFGKRCEIHPVLKSRKRKWMLHQTRISNVALRFDTANKQAQVMIEVSHKNENKRLQVFEIFEKYKEILEKDFKDGLTWNFLHIRGDSDQEVCRIYTKLENADFHNQKNWPDIYNFFIENMLILERNFLKIRDIIKEEIKNIE